MSEPTNPPPADIEDPIEAEVDGPATSVDQPDAAVSTGPIPSVVAAVEQDLGDIERALQRLDDGTYEICEACANPIELDRLESNPVVRTCSLHDHSVVG